MVTVTISYIHSDNKNYMQCQCQFKDTACRICIAWGKKNENGMYKYLQKVNELLKTPASNISSKPGRSSDVSLIKNSGDDNDTVKTLTHHKSHAAIESSHRPSMDHLLKGSTMMNDLIQGTGQSKKLRASKESKESKKSKKSKQSKQSKQSKSEVTNKCTIVHNYYH
eukprot:Pgem_evm2s20011